MRLQPANRRAVIITAAVSIAKAHGLHRVTHGAVAKQCRIETSVKTVRHYFGTQVELWQAVLIEVPELLGEGRDLGIQNQMPGAQVPRVCRCLAGIAGLQTSPAQSAILQVRSVQKTEAHSAHRAEVAGTTDQ